MTFRPFKRREPGSLHEALQKAIAQLGGVAVAADLIGRGADWLYSAADPNRERAKAALLNHVELRAMCRAGATAIAVDFAHQAGGEFLPPLPEAAPGAIHAALASYVTESHQVISEVITRAADGVFDRADALKALPEIDEALKALMALRALTLSVIDGGEALK